MKITTTKRASIGKHIFMSFVLLFCLESLQAQVSIFSETFNGNSHAFSLNTTTQSSTAAGYNPWVVNNSYVGGSGSLLCLSFPFTFSISNTVTQPAGITGSPASKYMHISSQEAINDGITCASYQAADGLCFFDEYNFTEMTNNISTIGYNNVNFKFWWLCGGAAGTTYGEVYFSLDGGTTWYPAAGTNQYLNGTSWTQATLTDVAFDNQAQLKFGFRFVNLTATTGLDPGFCVDDVLVEGTLTTSCDTDSSFSAMACDSYTSPSGMVGTSSNTYMDTIMNAAGCDSVITINLTINTATNSSFSETACDSYTSPSGMVWTSSNTYMDTIMNAAGCDSVMTINLTINTVDTAVMVNGFTLTANAAGATYQWLDCNNGNAPIPGETNQVFNPSGNGDYAVQITQNGCTATSACYNITGVGINNMAFASSILLHPNPSTGKLQLDLGENYANVQIQISNTNGQLVFDQNYDQANQLNLNLTNLVAGVYFVAIHTENKSAILKLIKE